MSAIGNDAPAFTGSDDGFDAEAEFLKQFMPAEGSDAEKPSDTEAEDQHDEEHAEDEEEETTETESEEGSDEDADEEQPSDEENKEGEEETDEGEKKVAGDETYVKVTVDGVEKEVSVKDLKRLYGQEQSLTKKSMKVSEQTKSLDVELKAAVARSNKLLERARAEFKQFEGIDFHLAAAQLPEEQYTALRQAATAAWNNVKFLEESNTEFTKEADRVQRESLMTTAKETIETLSGPVEDGGIEGWSQKLYGEVLEYGKSVGIPVEALNTLVDAHSIRILHKAMLYDKGTQAKVVTKKVNKTPKRVIKTSKSAPPQRGSSNNKSAQKKAMDRLAREGSQEAAQDAFLAMWATGDD